MSALEREIIEKYNQLQPDAKQRVRALIERDQDVELKRSDASEFDFEAWTENIEAIRADIRANNNGILPAMDVVDMLREIRESGDTAQALEIYLNSLHKRSA